MKRTIVIATLLAGAPWASALAPATGHALAAGVRSHQSAGHKVLRISPTCFVAGRRSWAHVTLNHVGSHDKVEFIWAMPHAISLGPGLGPGVYRAGASGVIGFAALSPARYGSGQIGRWVLVAEWPRAAHPFTRTSFRVAGSVRACSS